MPSLLASTTLTLRMLIAEWVTVAVFLLEIETQWTFRVKAKPKQLTINENILAMWLYFVCIAEKGRINISHLQCFVLIFFFRLFSIYFFVILVVLDYFSSGTGQGRLQVFSNLIEGYFAHNKLYIFKLCEFQLSFMPAFTLHYFFFFLFFFFSFRHRMGLWWFHILILI